MTDARFPKRRQSLTSNENSARPIPVGGTIAIARDHARQHVGDVINNYFGTLQQDEFDRQWLEVVEWLAPSEAANDLQKIIHKEALNTYEPGTGLWFTDGDPLLRWISGDELLRWLCGSGKASLHLRR